MAELEDFEYQLLAQRGYAGGAATATAAGEVSSASTYVDPNDGTVYEWDEKQKGWVPKVDDEFLAQYQANYGIDNTAATDSDNFAVPSLPPKALSTPSLENTASSRSGDPSKPKEIAGSKRINTEPEQAEAAKKPKGKQTPTWFEMDEDKNLNVYVSGLPLDITQEEFVEMMSKYGIVMVDEDGNPKVKLYRDVDGELKGDGLCCYLKPESIKLALDILDGSILRNQTISVKKAEFVLKGEYDPKKKKKKPKKKGNKQAKLLDWRERKAAGPTRKKCERIIVFRNVFDPKDFDEDPTLITDIRGDIQEECSKFGTVKKILMFDRHPEGIISVAFKEFEAADLCIQKMNQRWYAERQLEVGQWDGLTNFQVEETDQEREVRLKKWETFLKDSDGQKDDSKQEIQNDSEQEVQNNNKQETQ